MSTGHFRPCWMQSQYVVSPQQVLQKQSSKTYVYVYSNLCAPRTMHLFHCLGGLSLSVSLSQALDYRSTQAVLGKVSPVDPKLTAPEAVSKLNPAGGAGSILYSTVVSGLTSAASPP
jgi:hypothetical protein